MKEPDYKIEYKYMEDQLFWFAKLVEEYGCGVIKRMAANVVYNLQQRRYHKERYEK